MDYHIILVLSTGSVQYISWLDTALMIGGSNVLCNGLPSPRLTLLPFSSLCLSIDPRYGAPFLPLAEVYFIVIIIHAALRYLGQHLALG